MKRLWDSYATLVGIIPHSVESGNKYILPRKDRDEIERLTAKLRLQSHNTELRKKLTNMYYKGALGHSASTTMVGFNKSAGLLLSAGKEGKVRVWDPYAADGGPGQLAPVEGATGLDLSEVLQQGAAAKSFCWPEDDPSKIFMGTSTNSILEVEVDVETPAIGRVKELLSSHFGTLSGLAVHPTKPLFVTVGRDKSCNLWLSDSFSCASQARLTAPATSVCFSNNGDSVCIGLTNFE
jgi:WD40 repeat protein